MKSQPVEFLEVVERDLRYARAFYESWQFQGAEKFQAKFRDAVAWIEWNPELFPRKYKRFRRAIIRRTYFGLYYVIEPGVTVVVAVLDLRRDPRAIRQLLNVRIEQG
ncbi:MAG: hypothetical protein HY735_22285 [Verrucomicrobia bacterium]|nr:hypothetical protein [Verrucomicrobiota bacterium]